MNTGEFQDLLARRPFEPFRVRLSSGDAYEVRHPEMALLLRNGVYVAVPESQTNGTDELPDRAVWCSLLHIAALEPISSGNAK